MSVSAIEKAEYLDRIDAAKLLGLSPQTLAVWACSGRYALPYIRVGRLVRYRRSDLVAWLESRTVKNSSEVMAAAKSA